jgi:hypothetical protein
MKAAWMLAFRALLWALLFRALFVLVTITQCAASTTPLAAQTAVQTATNATTTVQQGSALTSTTTTAALRGLRTIEIFDSLAHRVTRGLAAEIKAKWQETQQAERGEKPEKTIRATDTIRCFFPDHSGSWLFEQYLPSDLRPFVVRRARASDTASRLVSTLRLHLADCAVRYFACEHSDDSLAREVQIILASTMESSSGVMQPIANNAATHRDTVARSAVSGLQSRQYDFTQGTVPEQQGSFWKTVVEPAVIVAAAALTIFLFFTVRTQ